MTSEKGSDRIHKKRLSYKCILPQSVKIDLTCVKMKLGEMIGSCCFHQTSNKIFDARENKISDGFKDANPGEEADEVVFFHFGEEIHTEEEILQIMQDGGFRPATLWHLLAAVKTGFTSNYTLVSLATKYESKFFTILHIRKIMVLSLEFVLI